MLDDLFVSESAAIVYENTKFSKINQTLSLIIYFRVLNNFIRFNSL